MARRSGVGYIDERPDDRDFRGVLWRRMSSRPGRGRPEFGKIHYGRQRHAMLRLLCQVCGQPADRDDDGVLWLLFDDRAEHPDLPDWPNQLVTPNPPVCLACARIAVRACPALRAGHVVVRVGHSTVAAVYGARYRPAEPHPVLMGDAIVGFDDPCIRWVTATQLLREITRCTVVTINGTGPGPESRVRQK